MNINERFPLQPSSSRPPYTQNRASVAIPSNDDLVKLGFRLIIRLIKFRYFLFLLKTLFFVKISRIINNDKQCRV